MDYVAKADTFMYTEANQTFYITITIKDNDVHDKNKKFWLYFKERDGCIPDEWVQICIWDDEWGEYLLKLLG